MSQSLSLNLEQKLQMKLSVQQLRFVKLLEFNAPELEEAVERELADNPALEKEEGDVPEEAPHDGYLSGRKGFRNDTDLHDWDFAPADEGRSLYDSLLEQLGERNLPAKVSTCARYIVGSLDSNGYLRRPLPSLVDDMAFGPGIDVGIDDMERGLEAVQHLDPPGVGATSLQECLLLQLQRIKEMRGNTPGLQEAEDAEAIISRQFEAFTLKHVHRIISSLKMERDRVNAAMDLILSLNPKPGASFFSPADKANTIIPDLIVTGDGGKLYISLNSTIPELRVSRSFEESVREMAKGNQGKRKGNEFIVSRYNDARDFIRILRQRQDTLVRVMTAIMKIQEEYFATEDVYRLKPMLIKDISALTGLDFSVISRATNNKYVSLPWGVFPLRFFFSDSIGEEGESSSDVLTNRKMEAEIRAIVENEDKRRPLSDEKIKEIMESRGYEVSRRTIAKYRDRTGIPVARLRRSMAD